MLNGFFFVIVFFVIQDYAKLTSPLLNGTLQISNKRALKYILCFKYSIFNNTLILYCSVKRY